MDLHSGRDTNSYGHGHESTVLYKRFVQLKPRVVSWGFLSCSCDIWMSAVPCNMSILWVFSTTELAHIGSPGIKFDQLPRIGEGEATCSTSYVSKVVIQVAQ